jgi:Transposase and inactivated derivatives
VERIVIGLPGYVIKKIISVNPLGLEAVWTGIRACPYCNCTKLRTKDSFWREIKSIRLHDRPSTLRVRCHKYLCLECGRYFNTRLPGVKLWGRATELLKKSVFLGYNKGCSNADIARDNGIGVATVERYYHQMIEHKHSHFQNRLCPRILGIDEHRFTRKHGFVTTFCDLQKRKVVDVALGRDNFRLHDFLLSLKGRERVRVVCIDMNSAYRNLVRQWFPNAMIVSDRFHVIRLVQHHFSKVCKLVDEAHTSYGRGRLMRLLMKRPDTLTLSQQERLKVYFEGQPALRAVYDFCHELSDLLRIKARTRSGCKKPVCELLDKIKQLRQSPFKAMRTLGKTLASWKEEVARMFRFTRSNGTTEGFHRKMKLIQRRAYGFRNFENYRLRVKVLCG